MIIFVKLGTYDLYAPTLGEVLNVTGLAHSLYYSIIIMLLIILLFSSINKHPYVCIFTQGISIHFLHS